MCFVGYSRQCLTLWHDHRLVIRNCRLFDVATNSRHITFQLGDLHLLLWNAGGALPNDLHLAEI